MSNEIKKNQEYGHKYFMTFLIALAGALCGSVIYIALVVFNIGEIGLVYLISGMAAYAFCAVFSKDNNWNKKNMIFVSLACFVNTIIAETVLFAIVYAPQMSGEGYETFSKKLFGTYNFSLAGYKNLAQVLLCFLLSIIACFVLQLIYPSKKWKKVNLYGRNRKESEI